MKWREKEADVCLHRYINRGICTNNLRIGAEEVESQLLSNLADEPIAVRQDQLLNRGIRASVAVVAGESDELSEMRHQKERLEPEIRNFTNAIAESGHSKYIVEEIAVREREIASITDRLLASSPDSMEARIEDLRHFVEDGARTLASSCVRIPP